MKINESYKTLHVKLNELPGVGEKKKVMRKINHVEKMNHGGKNHMKINESSLIVSCFFLSFENKLMMCVKKNIKIN